MVGRDHEIGEITRLIADRGARGIVLAGRAGVGKSRLAREVVTATAAAGWTVRSVAASVACCGWIPTYPPSRTCCWRRLPPRVHERGLRLVVNLNTYRVG
ncbi:ATP-binding protein [Mycobacterium asiaticum]|uniref:ATP-binding protein n=1 Tax=Mycobacterium asiaticum TaxID=1790 RepID=UPI003456DB54